MKIRTLLALFGLFIALFTVMGCDNNDDENRFALSGTVIAAESGDPVTGPVTVQAVNNGVIFSSDTTSTGAFTVGDLPEGQYLLYVTEENTDDQFVFGPVSVPAGGVVEVPIPATSPTPVGEGNGVLAFSIFQDGQLVPATVDVNGDVKTGAAIRYDLPAGTYDFTVTVGDQVTTYRNITLAAGQSLVIVQSVGDITPPPTGNGTLTGTIVNDRTGDTVTDEVAVRLYQNGQFVSGFNPVTVTNGQFIITDIPAGEYQLVLQGFNYVTTVYSPITITNNATTDIQVRTITRGQALALFPGLAPDATTGTLIVSATDNTGTPIVVEVDINNGQDIRSGTSPLLITGLNDADQLYTVKLTAGARVITAENVPIPDNQITLIARQAPAAN